MANPIDSRPYNGSLLIQGNQYIKGSQDADPDEASEKSGSKLYGQNGYQGASSDLPGERTCSGFLPDCKLPADYKGADWQTRSVSTKPYPTAHGNHAPRSGEKVPSTPIRRPTTSGR